MNGAKNRGGPTTLGPDCGLKCVRKTAQLLDSTSASTSGLFFNRKMASFNLSNFLNYSSNVKRSFFFFFNCFLKIQLCLFNEISFHQNAMSPSDKWVF